MMGKELLLEIGTEEIPAAFLPKALRDMEEIAHKELACRRIAHGRIVTAGTPRRLVLFVDDVAAKQDDQVIEKLGPAKRVAFDGAGNPTPAALGFAKGQGVTIAELQTVATDKGEYLCARKEVIGEATAGLLPELLTKVITDIPFRKSMRWADQPFRFARPIHWLLALYGGEVVPLAVAGIVSGRESRGHRFMAPGAFPVCGWEDYLARTRDHFVIVDPGERKRIIAAQIVTAADAVGVCPVPNEELLETVAFLTEYPTVVCGGFDREFLRLPREVLVTTMICHQKYFPVVDQQGDLAPWFLTVNNTLARDPDVVRRGNEKVIRARLSDARFFFEEDRKVPLESRVADLKKVMFHTLLGTSFDKVQRFRELAIRIAEGLEPRPGACAGFVDRVGRAAWLSKADLDTQMVGEFAELQGIMGREYALLGGEEPLVARAIYEHYLPNAAGGELPQTDEGAVVSIADKLDSICGFFGVNLIPSGTADPYALRRQALGVINIILDKGYPLPLDGLIDASLAILGERLRRPAADVKVDVLTFFRGRFENQLIAQGRPYDVVDAVLAAGATDLVQAARKVCAMEAFKDHPDFEPLAIGFKRVANIVKDFTDGAVDPGLFQCDAERVLCDISRQSRQRVDALIGQGDYPEALTELARLRHPVDAFFSEVLVMAEDGRVRFNRLSLLAEIAFLFRGLADFSRIVTEA